MARLLQEVHSMLGCSVLVSGLNMGVRAGNGAKYWDTNATCYWVYGRICPKSRPLFPSLK